MKIFDALNKTHPELVKGAGVVLAYASRQALNGTAYHTMHYLHPLAGAVAGAALNGVTLAGVGLYASTLLRDHPAPDSKAEAIKLAGILTAVVCDHTVNTAATHALKALHPTAGMLAEFLLNAGVMTGVALYASTLVRKDQQPSPKAQVLQPK
jgi:hypothetical protein